MKNATEFSRNLLELIFGIMVLSPVPACAQVIITTVAGNGERGFWGNGGQAISTPLNLGPFTGGVAVDLRGNLYIADTLSHRVYQVGPNGQRLTVAGSDCWVCAPEEQLAGDPHAGYSGDGGRATSALINSPTGVAVDGVGNIYIVDNGNQRIRKVDPQGIITTVAGNGAAGYSGDGGPAVNASLHFNRYTGNCAVDGSGNLYIADTENQCIRKVGANGIITTVASFFSPYSVAVDASRAIYIGGEDSSVVKVDTAGTRTVVAAGLNVPAGVAVDRAGNLYIADSHSHRVRKVQPNGVASVITGSGDPVFDPIDGYSFVGGFSGDGGPPTNAQLNFPWGVAVDNPGNVYIADSLNNRIRKVSTASTDDQHTFTNPTTIADGFSTELSVANPYPSSIEVIGLTGSVSKVTVTLNNVNFGSPAQADILLVGPEGQSAIIMSDAPGDETGHIINKTLTFDDDALSPLPSNNTLRSGTYKPTNFGSEADFFPVPAPVGPYGTALSVFKGTNPNGTWRLYEVDDTPDNPFDDFGPDVEITGGWSLTITTVPSETNPIDDSRFFVRQHYLDFLSREPETGEPWTAILNNCPDINNDPACDRITVSAAFFGSSEFQLKGYFVYRFYKLAFNRLPAYGEISVDMQAVTGQTPGEVYEKKAAFTKAYVQRTEFTDTYDSMTNARYVATLLGRYGLTQITTPEPTAPDGTNNVTLTNADLTNLLDTNTLTRAQVLRAIADSNEVNAAEYNQAFVAMQYYGYLRRAPEMAGYNAWLNYLNAHPSDFRTMVNGFMNSIEYRARFGP